MTDHRPLDPDDATDRRVRIALVHLGVTPDELGEHGVDALRWRLDQPDHVEVLRTIGHQPLDLDTDRISAGVREALSAQHGTDDE